MPLLCGGMRERSSKITAAPADGVQKMEVIMKEQEIKYLKTWKTYSADLERLGHDEYTLQKVDEIRSMIDALAAHNVRSGWATSGWATGE